MSRTHELVEIDPATGAEDQLLCAGDFAHLSQVRDEIIHEAEDDGYDFPWLRIQPAS